jgi:hypothetical protein
MTRALDLRMVFVGADHEGQEVAKVAPCCCLELAEHIFRRAWQAQIDVLRRSGALETKLEDQPPFSVAASPSTATMRARKRSKTRSCRLRAKSLPVLVALLRRCSSACLNPSGDVYVRAVMPPDLHRPGGRLQRRGDHLSRRGHDAEPAARPGAAGRVRPMRSCSREAFARVT